MRLSDLLEITHPTSPGPKRMTLFFDSGFQLFPTSTELHIYE